jgi:hypothetical protein
MRDLSGIRRHFELHSGASFGASSEGDLLRCMSPFMALVRHPKNADRRPLSDKPDIWADIAE